MRTLAIRQEVARLSSFRFFLCCLTVLGATACVRSQPMAVLRPKATVLKTSASPAPTSAPQARQVRLSGVVQAPAAMEARTANVKNGHAIGTPIRVIEAATGRVLKQDVTYYDGSFQFDLNAPASALPVVLAVDLVDAKDDQSTFTLEAPLVLEKAVFSLDKLAVSTGSTALVMMYRRWSEAATDTGQPSSYGLARYILSTSADTTKSFGLLVAQDRQIPVAADVASLKAALDAYVDRTQVKK